MSREASAASGATGAPPDGRGPSALSAVLRRSGAGKHRTPATDTRRDTGVPRSLSHLRPLSPPLVVLPPSPGDHTIRLTPRAIRRHSGRWAAGGGAGQHHMPRAGRVGVRRSCRARAMVWAGAIVCGGGLVAISHGSAPSRSRRRTTVTVPWKLRKPAEGRAKEVGSRERRAGWSAPWWLMEDAAGDGKGIDEVTDRAIARLAFRVIPAAEGCRKPQPPSRVHRLFDQDESAFNGGRADPHQKGNFHG